jgi:alpha-N-acetylglucosaminidase
MRYNADDLKPALTELLQVAPQIRSLPGYQHDLVDITRQILANESRRLLAHAHSI